MTDKQYLAKLLELSPYLDVLGGLEYYELAAANLIANGVRLERKQATSDKTSDESKRWIPVSERLPERGQEVIIYTGNIQKPTVLAYQFWNPKYDTWAHVTHWMPLPTPPEGE